jgi:hypothetical protein
VPRKRKKQKNRSVFKALSLPDLTLPGVFRLWRWRFPPFWTNFAADDSPVETAHTGPNRTLKRMKPAMTNHVQLGLIQTAAAASPVANLNQTRPEFSGRPV